MYFASLVLRENILYANGSNIRQWWIVHHYISLFTSFVFLIWPESSTQFQQFRTYYLIYLSYLSKKNKIIISKHSLTIC